MATSEELEDFLAQVERRAYKQAAYATRDDHAAMDIIQDAMMRLAEKYGRRPSSEFPMLFQRILQNAIRDYFRRQKVRNLWTTLLSTFSREDEDGHDPLETLAGEADPADDPAVHAERVEKLEIIERAIQNLPSRQRQAFLLRYWEDLDVAQTAEAMGCSEGSVKTHCSRAAHSLASMLRKEGVEL